MRRVFYPQSGLPDDLKGFRFYPAHETRGHDLSHEHPFIELHYCEKGYGFIQTGPMKYPVKPGVVSLLYAPVVHRIYIPTQSLYRRTVIHFPVALPAAHLRLNLGDLISIIPTGNNPCLQFWLDPKDHGRFVELLAQGYNDCVRWHSKAHDTVSQNLSEMILILKNAQPLSPLTPRPQAREITPYERLLVTHVEDMIQNNDRDTLNVSSLSKNLGMSPGHIRRIYAKVRKRSLRDFILFNKLARAEASLRRGASVTEAALAGFYTNVGNFSRTFKKYMGVSPTVYLSWINPR